MAKITSAAEAIRQGVYGFYLAERARQLTDEMGALMKPGNFGIDSMALASWAGRASVTLMLIAEEFAGPLPEPEPAPALPPATEPESIPSPCCPGSVARFTGNAANGDAWFTCTQCDKTHAMWARRDA